MLTSDLTRDSFISEVISKLYDEGFDNAASSNIRKIIEAIVSEEFFDSIQSTINGLNFSTMESSDLDYLFDELFGIPRFTQTIIDNQYLFIFNYKNKDNEPIFFNVGTQFKFNDEYYIVAENKKYVSSDNVNTSGMYCKKTNAMNFDKLINCGNVTFNFNDKITSGALSYEELKSIMEKDFVFIEQTNKTDNKETDSEYRLRANKIFQNMGYNNTQIISDKISSIYGVHSVTYKEYDFFTEFFIIPKSLSLLNNILNTATEICDYYKISSIKLRKPPVVNFIISGIDDNFYHSEFPDIKEKIKNYIENLINNDNVFNRDNFENFLYDYGNSKSSSFVLNEDNIKITYEIYSENNYIDQANATPVIVKTIPKNTSKKFTGVIFTCGDIN